MKKLTILSVLTIMIMLVNLESNAQKIYDFVSVDKVPNYPGGMNSFYQYLGNSIKFPEAAKKNKTEGKVFLSFVVETTGKLTDVEVIKGLTKETNAEAVRAFEESPKWNPGIVKGKPVRVKYNIAVTFRNNKVGTPKTTPSFGTNNPKTPQFPGGQTKLYSYLAKTIKYPQQAQKNNVQGKVLLSFYVEKNGSLTNIQVVKSLSKETDEEALRVIKNSPKWLPAVDAAGRTTRVKYNLPINFTLS